MGVIFSNLYAAHLSFSLFAHWQQLQELHKEYNDPAFVISRGVDGIITDSPDLLLKLLNP